MCQATKVLGGGELDSPRSMYLYHYWQAIRYRNHYFEPLGTPMHGLINALVGQLCQETPGLWQRLLPPRLRLVLSLWKGFPGNGLISIPTRIAWLAIQRLYADPLAYAVKHRDLPAEMLPLLHHLQPPVSMTNIRFDRYSPYFRNREELEFELKPHPLSQHVYPLPSDQIAELAYHFYRVPLVSAGPGVPVVAVIGRRRPRHSVLQGRHGT